MKPSEVQLFVRSFLPLVGLFERSENEFGAALLVRLCVKHGDVFAAHGPKAFGELMKEDRENNVEPWSKFYQNPFVFPDIRGLVQAGYAEFEGDAEKGGPVRFTDKGLQKLALTVEFLEPSP
jgi:hypothetical protein